MSKILHMSISIETKVTLIPSQVQKAGIDLNIVGRGLNIISAGDVVLGRAVAVSEKSGRKTRNRVVLVCHPICVSPGSGSEVFSYALKTDFGGTIGVLQRRVGQHCIS